MMNNSCFVKTLQAVKDVTLGNYRRRITIAIVSLQKSTYLHLGCRWCKHVVNMICDFICPYIYLHCRIFEIYFICELKYSCL